jgi:hypothetical protein
MMGHEISTTMIYVHDVPQVDAAEKMSRLLDGEQPDAVESVPA